VTPPLGIKKKLGWNLLSHGQYYLARGTLLVVATKQYFYNLLDFFLKTLKEI
jgi:hypothetical protein